MTRKQKYFVKQKLIGLLMVVISILVNMRISDFPISLIFVPLGLNLMFTKHVVWMDNYFFEIEKRRERRMRTH